MEALPYVEPLREARTPLADFFSILLKDKPFRSAATSAAAVHHAHRWLTPGELSYTRRPSCEIEV